MKAGTAKKDITPAAGMEIVHPARVSKGVHDPLFLRALVLDDEAGTTLAIVCFDLIGAGFEVTDQIREAVKEHTGIEPTLLNFSHPHSSRGLGLEWDNGDTMNAEKTWNDGVHRAVLEAVTEAKAGAVPVSLRVGRASAQVGFNRRLADENGFIIMDVNKNGAVVPWVNVLVAEEQKSGEPVAVLFEHAAHPVIAPDTSCLISADYPGAAVVRINEKLGDDVMPMFAQGCGGNINGYPLRSTQEKADQAGRKLGDAVLQAMRESTPIKANRFVVRSASTALPCRELPSLEVWQEAIDRMEKALKDKDGHWVHEEAFHEKMESFNVMKELIERGEDPPSRRLDAYAVMLGAEWCLVTMPHEMFCEYELWVDQNAPFEHTMTFSYTNGGEGYVGTDEALALGEKGGYEAGAFPCWWPHGPGSGSHSPPAVGTEGIIKDTIASLWQAR